MQIINMNKKLALFLNLVAPYPVAELHASQKDFVHSFDEVLVFRNSWATRFNHFNPLGRPVTFVFEKQRAKSVGKFLEMPVHPIILKGLCEIDVNVEDYQRIDESVMSSVASYLRITDETQLNDKWQFIRKKLIKNSLNIHRYFLQELKNNYTDVAYFNGRFCEDVAFKTAAQRLNLNYKVYDFKKAGSYYEFNNSALHNVYENCSRAKKYYLHDRKRAYAVAEEFVSKKLIGEATYEKSYTSKQKYGVIQNLIDERKVNISVFPSSDDEYRFLAGDWGVPIVKDQVVEIKNLAKTLGPEFNIIVRMHPNMIDMARELYDRYLDLQSLPNIHLIDAASSASTYELMSRTEFVVSFCSTMGVEATFAKKKSISIGGSPYHALPVTEKAYSGAECAELIKKNKIKIKSKLSAIIWMNYLWKYSQENPYIRETRIEENNQRGNEFLFDLTDTHFYRLLTIYERFELQIIKGQKINRKILKSWSRAFLDILTNKSSNKID